MVDLPSGSSHFQKIIMALASNSCKKKNRKIQFICLGLLIDKETVTGDENVSFIFFN